MPEDFPVPASDTAGEHTLPSSRPSEREPGSSNPGLKR